jgi:hypothetical protein
MYRLSFLLAAVANSSFLTPDQPKRFDERAYRGINGRVRISLAISRRFDDWLSN